MVILMSRKRSMSKICLNEEVSSKEWEFVNLNKDEEDLVYRMHKLLGDRWELIAGRIPGRRAEEIERFWLMKHGEQFAEKRRKSIANASK